MIKRFSLLVALLMTLSLAVTPVAAQGVDLDDPESMGIVGGYGRLYFAASVMDLMMSGEAPDADTLDGLADVYMIMVLGLEFASADIADENLDGFLCSMLASYLELETDVNSACDDVMEEGVELIDVEGLGDRAIESTVVMDEDPVLGFAGKLNLLLVRDGSTVYVFLHIGPGAEAGTADPLAAFLFSADPSDTEVVFDEDGGSTGGFFDMLPPADGPLLADFIPVADMDMGAELSAE
ncbi:MAG: hypothetical protein M9934_00640 [Thermomicrobiales bacterium]|nr:hypothetical protein [Thermomicrobiales bacterium]